MNERIVYRETKAPSPSNYPNEPGMDEVATEATWAYSENDTALASKDDRQLAKWFSRPDTWVGRVSMAIPSNSRF